MKIILNLREESFNEKEEDAEKRSFSNQILEEQFAQCQAEIDRYHKSIKFFELVELLKRQMDKAENNQEQVEEERSV